MADGSNLFCNVCKHECGTAHKCINCNQYSHLPCGVPQGDEDDEGYGQGIICNLCIKQREAGKLNFFSAYMDMVIHYMHYDGFFCCCC